LTALAAVEGDWEVAPAAFALLAAVGDELEDPAQARVLEHGGDAVVGADHAQLAGVAERPGAADDRGHADGVEIGDARHVENDVGAGVALGLAQAGTYCAPRVGVEVAGDPDHDLPRAVRRVG